MANAGADVDAADAPNENPPAAGAGAGTAGADVDAADAPNENPPAAGAGVAVLDAPPPKPKLVPGAGVAAEVDPNEKLHSLRKVQGKDTILNI